MLKRLFTTTFAVLSMAMGSVTLPAFGQTGLLGDPELGVGPTPDVQGQFETSLFDYDAQFFAPLTLDDIRTKPQGNTGWYFTYDRTYMAVSRPEATSTVNANAVATGNDFMWGNRFDIGHMGENGAGWSLNWLNSEGSFFSQGQDELIANPLMTRNTMANVELSRLFRQELSNGGLMEPYFGFRWQGINDETIEDTIVPFFSAGDGNRFKQRTSNSSFGGHVGSRYSRTVGRWSWRADAAVAAGYNTQRYLASDMIFGEDQVAVFEATFNDNSFVPTLDLGVDAAFHVTRDLALRAGVQALHMWSGVVRADTRPTGLNPFSAFGLGEQVTGVRDQSFTAIGFTFGLEWRR
jgi:hypothetical protein